MRNKWSKKDAQAFARRQKGAPKALSETVYASRLLGAESALVRHGGGNASVKLRAKTLAGKTVDALYVKGSGQDMADATPAGFPALDLADLQAVEARRKLSDDDMLRLLTVAKLDPDAPRPSVETLFHAFFPHRVVLHTHANALLALTNQPDGKALAERVLGKGVIVLPYAMSGFALAKKAAAAWRKQSEATAVLVMKHGLFTFGETAEDAYKTMIRLVSLAETRLKKAATRKLLLARTIPAKPELAEIAPALRGALAGGAGPKVLDFRTGKAILAYVNGRNLKRYGTAGPATPDHVIWTKPAPVILESAEPTAVAKAVDRYRAAYTKFFEAQNARRGDGCVIHDPDPRVALVPGLGLFGIGETPGTAKIAADLAETNVDVITAAEKLGRFIPATKGDIFDIEYWSPETAKRAASAPPPLRGRVCVVTGGGSGIGAATARAFAARGAAVAVLDLHEKSAQLVAAEIGGLGLACDVTDGRSVRRAFDELCQTFGGVDIVVSNAGAAWQGEIGTVDDAVLRKSFELNFFAHQSVAQNAVRIMRAQNVAGGTGGCLLFNTSKQAVNPGKDFGPYGLPKAATLFLVRQYALDHGKDGIRTGGVNADRIRSGLLTDEMIKARSTARGLSEKDYMSGNLLGREVTAEDVAKAFVDLALSPSTTAAVITVDGGNIEAALR
jgi:rhamnose utilization protein RhaD (predicted bifunctional aldolase and dehydrogenase)/NAD(P)-dependent dehydrogenase (short-subunit alcohol dehydrogenase family)